MTRQAEASLTRNETRQAKRCVSRECGILELFYQNRIADLDAIDSGEDLADDEDTQRPPPSADLSDAYAAYMQHPDPESAPAVRRELRQQIAFEFVKGGFCPELSPVSPQQQYEAGHADECVWLDEQIVYLRNRRPTDS